mmetsp:Transcript_69822/g.103857  ORF Transcript_69822/g.103857 Transcript_69822/m.103857 type:complete len:105 (-) Transcript_69822:50-364(-)
MVLGRKSNIPPEIEITASFANPNPTGARVDSSHSLDRAKRVDSGAIACFFLPLSPPRRFHRQNVQGGKSYSISKKHASELPVEEEVELSSSACCPILDDVRQFR